jgi:hypothetical protein
MEGTENKAQNDEEDDESDEDEQEEESQDANDENAQIETFKKIIPCLKPQESLLKAIKRLGKSSGGSGAASGSLSASQRWLKKKNQSADNKMETESASNAQADREALEKLTGYANYFIDQGFYDIYEETRETLQKKVDNYENRSSKQTSAATSLDIFADEVDEKDLKPSTSGEQKGLEGKNFQFFFYFKSLIHF